MMQILKKIKKGLIRWKEGLYNRPNNVCLTIWFDFIRPRTFHGMRYRQTLQLLETTRCCLARYGDGELGMVLSEKPVNLGFQKVTSDLAARLRDLFVHPPSHCLICLPAACNTSRPLNARAWLHWVYWTAKYGSALKTFLKASGCKTYCFGDSLCTRPYMDYRTSDRADWTYAFLKRLFAKKELLIVEGEQTGLGIGNDLLDSASSIQRILAPAVNAFDCYDDILAAVRQFGQGKLILAALGPTATLLAADCAREGLWCVDLGHIDIEYEWYL